MNIKIRYLLWFIVVSLCFSVISLSLAAEGSKYSVTSKEIIFFRNEGAHSPFEFIEVSIRADGSGVTIFERYGEKSVETSFKLNQYEMDELKALVYEVNFFSQSDQQTTFIEDTGKSTLRISLEDKQKEIMFFSLPEIQPLISSLWKLINQGVILWGLNEKDDVYPVNVALSGHLVGQKVFQPQVFRDPLMKFISRSNDRQKLIWSFEALSWVMTPEEWTSFLSAELGKAKDTRKSLLLEALSSHPFTGNILKPHRQALLSLLLKNLQLEYIRWPQFSKEKKESYESIIRFLGYERYAPATPILISMIEKPYRWDISWLRNSLSLMGMEAIKPLEHLLNDPESDVRAVATDMLGEILRANPDWPTKGSVSEEEQKRILNTLETSILPKLKRMIDKDPDDSVRKAAQQSVQQIKQGWCK
ncbi:MAG: HEAT repeat domain-containing protein [Candidatus Omnitrophota bacterium]